MCRSSSLEVRWVCSRHFNTAASMQIFTKQERRAIIHFLFAEGVVPALGFTPSANKRRTTVLISFLQIDNGAVLLNSLLHPNDYEERRLIRCIEVLPTALQSALDANVFTSTMTTLIG
ncbi:hypothetical protein TNCV_1403401 [Trichonephila clavipes]|nr:hypothetical protein TNCV_1403401 [Trichonephila clavipes]